MEYLKSDNMQFIVIKDGKEVDWIDPVLEIIEDEKGIHVTNAYQADAYDYPLGTQYIVRMRDE